MPQFYRGFLKHSHHGTIDQLSLFFKRTDPSLLIKTNSKRWKSGCSIQIQIT
jgi:hypothetical protein